jgi:hypothetical protein
MSDRQDRLEAHLIELQDLWDEGQFQKVACNVGTPITPADIPAELQSVKQKIATIESKTIPDLQKHFEVKISTIVGASHECSLTDVAKKAQEAFNAVEKHRKRLRHVEDLTGSAVIVKEVKSLQYLPHLQLAANISTQPNPPPSQPQCSQPDPRRLTRSSSTPQDLHKGKAPAVKPPPST